MLPLVDKEEVLGTSQLITNEYYKVQMASILHDIGKFWQRTGKHHHDTYSTLNKDDFGNIGAHSKWSASFIKEIGLDQHTEELVLRHHKPSSLSGREKFLANIVSKADSYSCKERIDLGYTVDNVRKEPLISVFSKLKLNSNNMREYYYPLRKLGLKELALPVESKRGAMGGWSLQPDYEELWKEFLEEAKSISNMNSVPFGTIYYLLKKYTSFMPSAVYKDYPDIALFDHLKTTAAIASCMYMYLTEKSEYSISDKTKYFTLISGDISGIQNFIYNISSPQFAQKGMAKRLRGRSFYINLLNENLARMITERLELTDANILWCGGGYFLIVASNTDKTTNILREYEKEVNEFLFKKYGGKLFLSLISQTVSGRDLDNFTTLKENILFETSRNKRQRYLNNLDMVFEEEEYIPSDICEICGSISNGDVCSECITHEDLGDKITKAEYIIRAVLKDSTENKFDFKEFNVGYLLLKKENLLEEIEKISRSSSKIQIFALNNTNFLDREIIKKLEEKNIQVSFGFSFLGNTVPYHEKYGPLYFEHIAKMSIGTKKLGILKMNVDNLEKLFEIGLGSTVSISRVSTMSSLIDIFISGYINDLMKEYYILPDVCTECREKVDEIQLTFFDKDNINIYREKEREGKIEKVCSKCTEKKIPMLYICYSGGDDILIIGPWDVIVRFSKDIRDKFKKYTCMNPDVNISAGIYICGPKFPIDRSAHIVNEMLNKSKIHGKDRIVIFNEIPVMWEPFDRFKGYDELLQFAYQLELLMETKKVSHGFVYSLLMLKRDKFDDLEGSELEDKIIARIERKRYVPILKYKLARVIEDNNIREDLNKKLIVEKMLPWIEIPASIAILKWRQK